MLVFFSSPGECALPESRCNGLPLRKFCILQLDRFWKGNVHSTIVHVTFTYYVFPAVQSLLASGGVDVSNNWSFSYFCAVLFF